ncbi:MAG: hypothetical protein AAF727_01010 [Pseudomonadota bacterium]
MRIGTVEPVGSDQRLFCATSAHAPGTQKPLGLHAAAMHAPERRVQSFKGGFGG